MKCIKCGSFAINEGNYDRVRGVDSDLCDVHYWMKRAASITELQAQLEAAKKSNPWIPVSERLPEHSTDVLTLVRHGASIRQTVAGYFPLTSEKVAPMGWLEFSAPDKELNVTHWMSPPESPAIQAEGKQA